MVDNGEIVKLALKVMRVRAGITLAQAVVQVREALKQLKYKAEHNCN